MTLFFIEMKRDIAYYLVSFICLLILIASFVLVAVLVDWEDFIWRVYVFVGLFMALCIIIAEVNHFNKFQSMTAYFHRYRYTLILIFFILSIGDFILLELSDVDTEKCDWDTMTDDCPLLNPDENGLFLSFSSNKICENIAYIAYIAISQKYLYIK